MEEINQISSELSENGTEEEVKVDDERVIFDNFFEEFFDDLLTSKKVDTINARNYIFKSVHLEETEFDSTKEFLHEFFYLLYKKEELTGYYKNFIEYNSIQKVGLFKHEQYDLIETLVTILQNAFVSSNVFFIQEKLLVTAFSYLNDMYKNS